MLRWAGLVVAIALVGPAVPVDRAEVVQVQMRNVMYHFTPSAAVHITRLDGELRPTAPETVPSFDDERSFLIEIRSAEIFVTTDVLAALLNQQVFAAPDAPIKNLEIIPEGTRLKVKGKLHSKGDLSFETEGSLSVTPDGEVRIHSEHVKAAHLPVKGIMDLLGVKIADLISTKKVRGLRVDGNDLLLEPTRMLPPPEIEGRMTAISVQGNQIVQVFGGKADDTRGRAGNYMSYQGGQLKFGKLTMSPADLVLIDPDPRDPFDFFFARYKQQLVAGYTKTTPQDGLRVYMPDFGKLKTKTPRHK